MKKMLAMLLSLLMVISCCALPAFAAEEEPVKLSILKAGSTSVWDPVNNPALAKIQEEANVELDVHLVDDITQSINLAMASGEMTDIIVAPNFTFLEYVNTGYLVELSDLLEEHGQNLLANISQQGWDYVTLDGQIYCIPQENLNSKWPTAIRSDWVEKLGFEVKDTYTVSELKEILIAFAKNDPDGNGVEDTYGMNAYGGGWKNTCLAIYGAFGGQPDQYYLDEDNQFYAFNTSDGFRNALTYIHELWEAGAIDPEFFVAGGDQAKQKATNGKIGYFTGWWSAVRDVVTNGFVELVPDGDFKRVYVTSDDGTMQGVTDNGLITNTTFITTNCEDPVAAMKFLNYLMEDGYMLATYGMEGVHYDTDEEGRVSNVFSGNVDYTPLAQVVRRLDQVRFHDARPLGEDADKATKLTYDFQMIQYAENQALYTSIFYGLPTTNESLEYNNELSNYVSTKVVEFITGETEITDETWKEYKDEWTAKGGVKVLESYAKLYNETNGTDYTVAE